MSNVKKIPAETPAPHIIEEIEKRRREKERRDDRPQPQLPLYDDEPPPDPPKEKEPNPDGDRGVVIIEPGSDGQSSRDRGVTIISFF